MVDDICTLNRSIQGVGFAHITYASCRIELLYPAEVGGGTRERDNFMTLLEQMLAQEAAYETCRSRNKRFHSLSRESRVSTGRLRIYQTSPLQSITFSI
jgi:hypothetical protein